MSIARQLSTGYAKLAALSPEGYSAALHIRYAYPLATHITYPSPWIEYYSENAFALRDPLVAWALSTEGAIRWSEIGLPDPFGIFEKGEEFGLKFGVAISVGELKSRSVVGCARGDREFSDSEIKEIHSVVKFLHETAAPRAVVDRGAVAGAALHRLGRPPRRCRGQARYLRKCTQGASTVGTRTPCRANNIGSDPEGQGNSPSLRLRCALSSPDSSA